MNSIPKSMTLAIIGASYGQQSLCIAAREMGLRTICFAWSNGAVCKDLVDVFYPISILDKDRIVSVCRSEHVCGVVSNASDLTTEIVSYVAEKLNLNGNRSDTIRNIKNKYWVRERTNSIEGLSPVAVSMTDKKTPPFLPCIVKPMEGSSKQGVSLATDPKEFSDAVEYAVSSHGGPVLVEQFVDGREISVETLSYKGVHYLIQCTDKLSTGAPHFVEIEHHQPASLSCGIEDKLSKIVPNILKAVGLENGASHLEFKIDEDDNVFLIEINPRGGGDCISDTLVRLSTGYDYIKGMIEVAIDRFSEPLVSHNKYSGIYFLCEQTNYLFPVFLETSIPSWVYRKQYDGEPLSVATGNTDRNGYLIYCSEKKIIL